MTFALLPFAGEEGVVPRPWPHTIFLPLIWFFSALFAVPTVFFSEVRDTETDDFYRNQIAARPATAQVINVTHKMNLGTNILKWVFFKKKSGKAKTRPCILTVSLPRNKLALLEKAHEKAIFGVTDHACMLTWLLEPLLFPYLFMASQLTDKTSGPSGALLDSRHAACRA